jgi:hypothetical protein
MVIEKIDVLHIRAFKLENDPPICSNGDAPEPGIIALELMQSKAGQVHILGLRGTLKPCQDACDLFDMLRIQAAPVVIFEQPAQAAMAEAQNRNVR